MQLPDRAHPDDAGLDLVARTETVLPPNGGRAGIPTGLAVAIDPGYVGLVVPRSGLALRNGVTVLNAPGVIDSGYRGELVVILINLDPSNEYLVSIGDRIAQLVVTVAPECDVVEVAELPLSSRGSSGLGASGR